MDQTLKKAVLCFRPTHNSKDDPVFREVLRCASFREDEKTFWPDTPGTCARGVLDAIGLQLVELAAKQEEARRIIAHLWRKYLIDCQKTDIVPQGVACRRFTPDET